MLRNDRTEPEALAAADEAVNQPPAFVLSLAMTLHSTTRIELLKRAQLQAPSDYWLNYQLGGLLTKWETSKDPMQVHEGLGYLRATVALRPSWIGGHMNIARALANLDRFDEALAWCDEIVELSPEYGYQTIGEISLGKHKLDEAVAALQKAIELKPSVWLHFSLGRARLLQGKLDEAIACYHRAIELDPSYAAAFTELFDALKQQGKTAEAMTAYEQSLAILERHAREHPNVAKFQSALGAILNNMALLDQNANRLERERDRLLLAVEYQKRSLALNPDNPESRGFLRNHYANLNAAAKVLGDTKLAAVAQQGLAELLASDPQFAQVNQRLNAVRNGEAAKDTDELLALAKHAIDRSRITLAAQLFGEALCRDPKLTESRIHQHAYNAACCATLAASGQDVDNPRPTEKDQKELRSQAFSWLQYELERWYTFLDSATDEQRKLIVGTMQHWQTDPDLTSVRAPEQLGEMPEEERNSWTTLWTRVAELLAKASKDPEHQ